MMEEMNNSATCERADDLVSVLYGEASEREQREFELHVKQCASCRAEFAAFAQVREAVGEWRDEALNGFVSSPGVATPPRKSAIAALRQFLNLSPLRMKGAIGFAVLLFCLLVVLAFGRLSSSSQNAPQVAVQNPQTGYTKQDLDRAVQDALEKQAALAKPEREQRVIEVAKPKIAVTSAAKDSTLATSAPRSRRPFSRAEREQLAAELRLLTTSEENELESPDK